MTCEAVLYNVASPCADTPDAGERVCTTCRALIHKAMMRQLRTYGRNDLADDLTDAYDMRYYPLTTKRRNP